MPIRRQSEERRSISARCKKKYKKSDGTYDKSYKVDPEYRKFNITAHQEWENYAAQVKKQKCQKVLRCFLSPYDPSECCPDQTPHHIVDAASFLEGPQHTDQNRYEQPKLTGWKNYDIDAAPCVCVEGPDQTTATHGEMHLRQGVVAFQAKDGKWTLAEATKTGVEAVQKTFPEANCSAGCLEAQLNRFHEKAQTTPDRRPINANVEMAADPTKRNRIAKQMGVPGTFR